MEVQIQWPFQLAPPLGRRSGLGKWLLYLTGIPEIAPLGAGQCFVNPRTVNSLGLREKGPSMSRSNNTDYFSSSDSSVKRKKRNAHVSDLSAIHFNHHSTDTSDLNGLSNTESGYVAFTMDSNSRIVLDCSSDQVQCHTFTCSINNLRANESAVIRIRYIPLYQHPSPPLASCKPCHELPFLKKSHFLFTGQGCGTQLSLKSFLGKN